MFGYNHPNLKELLGYPYLAWVIALATVRIVPEGAWRELATFGYHAVCVNLAIVPSIFLVKQFQEQMYKGEPSDDPAPISQPAKYLDMNKADAGGNVYAQVVPGVKFNKVRRFASTLLNMRSVSESSVDLREDTWRVHFGGRDGYIKTRVRFENVGAFVRKDARPNSPYIVKRWDVVQDVANGNKRALQ